MRIKFLRLLIKILANSHLHTIRCLVIGSYGRMEFMEISISIIILIYLVNKDFIFFRKNGLIVEFETFFKDKTLEIEKINISDISKDLQIPKESVRRKVEELEKKE